MTPTSPPGTFRPAGLLGDPVSGPVSCRGVRSADDGTHRRHYIPRGQAVRGAYKGRGRFGVPPRPPGDRVRL